MNKEGTIKLMDDEEYFIKDMKILIKNTTLSNEQVLSVVNRELIIKENR